MAVEVPKPLSISFEGIVSSMSVGQAAKFIPEQIPNKNLHRRTTSLIRITERIDPTIPIKFAIKIVLLLPLAIILPPITAPIVIPKKLDPANIPVNDLGRSN